MAQRRTANWRMADRLAGGNLDEIVAFHVGDDRTWTWISDRLRDEFGIEASRVTLRKWYPHLSPTADDEAVA